MISTSKVQLRGLYKIFGATPVAMMQHVRAGVGKSQLLASHKHVLGLQDINIDMPAGKTTVVMGLSGSGKSTLIRHLNRLIEPTAGEILIDGKDVMGLSQTDLRELRQKRMSMVFQKFALFPHRTVLQNAALALQAQGVDQDARESEARQWLARVGLEGYESRYPAQLSGGMQQRVGIARALTSNSDIMLMDEAFSALDPMIRTDMQNLLLELQEELHKTIIFITHDLDEALKLADHLVILKDGGVVQQGEPQSILLNPAAPYIEDFVSDINRARVLRVRSVMNETPPELGFEADVSAEDTLETLITLSGGDASKIFRVLDKGKPVGTLAMLDLVKALVPRMPAAAARTSADVLSKTFSG
ncbi:quaternary amine ABC transporter ATP-binding protein [Leisingera thetidis]|uniref:quaternary amine ABC transporter ATP-binding protein n=1 Tax=Leisingera thetidis TaxID=2930199 RepID=UPI0021F7044D|nr:betaine/proline/choline family ABC transporter ATP-binding protein [Leisingera thetidis]